MYPFNTRVCAIDILNIYMYMYMYMKRLAVELFYTNVYSISSFNTAIFWGILKALLAAKLEFFVICACARCDDECVVFILLGLTDKMGTCILQYHLHMKH